MSPAETLFWQRAQRRAAEVSPDLSRLLLRAFDYLRQALPKFELERIIQAGDVDAVFRKVLTDPMLDRVFAPFRDRLRAATQSHLKYFAQDLPKGPSGLTIAFDTLNPKVIDAVRALDTKVMQNLKADVREVFRAHVENGLRDGQSPKQIAASVRDVIGLAPKQEEAVRTFQTMLEEGDRAALRRALRDRRYDTTLDRLLGGDGLAPAQIDRMVVAYRRKMLAFNAETNARTAALDSMKLGQKLSIDEAVRLQVYDSSRLFKRWIGVMDDRERPEHVAMEKEEAPFDEAYSNGEMIPGESTYNCRCVSVYFQR